MAKKHVYAVHIGRKRGLFPEWAMTEPLVKGYSGAVYKGFGAGPKEHRKAKIFWKTGEESGPPIKWYGVINGMDTAGIYTSWNPASKAIRRIRDAKAKKFGTLISAKTWMINNGVEAFKIQVFASFFQQYESFQQLENEPFDTEFMRLARSQGWDPNSEEYRIRWTYTLAAEIEIEFCEPPIPDSILDDATPEEAELYEGQRWLRGCQALCEAARQTPGDTTEQCAEIFNNTMIDIVDLLDELRTGTPAKTWTDEEEFLAYTEQRTKRIHLPTAQANSFMSLLIGGADNLKGADTLDEDDEPEPNKDGFESDIAEDELPLVKDELVPDEILRGTSVRTNASFPDPGVQSGRIEKSAKFKEKRYTKGKDKRLEHHLRESKGDRKEATLGEDVREVEALPAKWFPCSS